MNGCPRDRRRRDWSPIMGCAPLSACRESSIHDPELAKVIHLRSLPKVHLRVILWSSRCHSLALPFSLHSMAALRKLSASRLQ